MHGRFSLRTFHVRVQCYVLVLHSRYPPHQTRHHQSPSWGFSLEMLWQFVNISIGVGIRWHSIPNRQELLVKTTRLTSNISVFRRGFSCWPKSSEEFLSEDALMIRERFSNRDIQIWQFVSILLGHLYQLRSIFNSADKRKYIGHLGNISVSCGVSQNPTWANFDTYTNKQYFDFLLWSIVCWNRTHQSHDIISKKVSWTCKCIRIATYFLLTLFQPEFNMIELKYLQRSNILISYNSQSSVYTGRIDQLS